MAYTLVAKPVSSTARDRILTPDGNQILVGSGQDMVLIYQEESDYWDASAKPTASWSNLAKPVSSWSATPKNV